MIRTQISLTEDQWNLLRATAAAQKTSMSALIRDAVDAVYAPPPEQDLELHRIVGLIKGGEPIESLDDAFADSIHDWHDR